MNFLHAIYDLNTYIQSFKNYNTNVVLQAFKTSSQAELFI